MILYRISSIKSSFSLWANVELTTDDGSLLTPW